jgi:hypothetical protein
VPKTTKCSLEAIADAMTLHALARRHVPAQLWPACKSIGSCLGGGWSGPWCVSQPPTSSICVHAADIYGNPCVTAAAAGSTPGVAPYSTTSSSSTTTTTTTSSAGSNSPQLDFNDYQSVFSGRTTPDLLRAYLVLKVSGMRRRPPPAAPLALVLASLILMQYTLNHHFGGLCTLCTSTP